MPVISFEEARQQYEELTGRKSFRSNYDDFDLPSSGGVRFIRTESEKEARSVSNRCPETYATRRRRQESGFEVAIYEKPKTRKEGEQIRSKLRSRWGTFR